MARSVGSAPGVAPPRGRMASISGQSRCGAGASVLKVRPNGYCGGSEPVLLPQVPRPGVLEVAPLVAPPGALALSEGRRADAVPGQD